MDMIKTIDPSKLTKGQHFYIAGRSGVFVACFPGDDGYCSSAVNIDNANVAFPKSSNRQFIPVDLEYDACPEIVKYDTGKRPDTEPNDIEPVPGIDGDRPGEAITYLENRLKDYINAMLEPDPPATELEKSIREKEQAQRKEDDLQRCYL